MSAMGTVVVKIPLVTWREGRPRYWPSAAQRALGYGYEDLRHADGRWFSLDEAIAWSKSRQADIDRRRLQAAEPATAGRPSSAAPSGAQPPAGGVAGVRTVGELITLWLDLPRFAGVDVVEGKRRRQAASANTVRFYKTCARALETHRAGRVWHQPAAAVTAKAMSGIIERIEVEHGLAMTRGVRAMLSVCYGWAVKEGHVLANPVAGVKLPMPAPRLRAGEAEEIAALVEVADRIGRPEIGDAIMLGVWTGQRQADRLALAGGQMTDDGILFRQAKKHGQPLLIPVSPQLAARLAAARERRRDWRVNWPHVVLDEKTRRPFEADWYRKLFRVVRDIAATGKDPKTLDSAKILRGVDLAVALSGYTPLPSIADLRDQDLRDTAVTWLARAGCSIQHIASITGHELGSVQSVLKHYLGLHPELARTAIGKLVEWMDGQGG